MVSNYKGRHLRRPRPKGNPDDYRKPADHPTSYVATEADRRKVRLLAGFGLKQEEICLLLINPRTGSPIHKETLWKHYRLELDIGMVEADAQVAQALFTQCVGRKAEYDDKGNQIRAEVVPNVTAQIYWTKARLGWRENINLNIRGQVAVGTPAELAAMSDKDLDEALRAEISAAQLMLAGKIIEGEVTE